MIIPSEFAIHKQKYALFILLEAKRRLVLTVTPLHNNLLELMSLLSFFIPFKLLKRKTFSRARVSDSIVLKHFSS